MPKWTPEQIKSTLVGKKFYEDNSAGVRPAEPKRIEGEPLVRGVPSKEEGIPRALLDGCNRYRIHFDVWSKQPCDWDNYRIKYLQDGLIKLGVLPGDSFELLEGSITSHKADSKQDERTEITLTRLA